ncbi:MAG: hypothetical protein GY839_05305, partial [candidate division Zixibacteria bacterium]|nr:hypothetical protein [candidate division Zixibacteria bacterium]
DENGIFTVNLAGVDGADFNGAIRYLGIKVGTDTEMTPRQRINSAPYSYSTQDIPSNSVNSANITDNTITSSDILNSTIVGADISNGSITDADIADEPGIAHTFQNINATLLTSTTIIDSVMITVPTSGNIVYQAAGAVELRLSASGEVKTIISLSASRTSMDYDNMTNFDLGVQVADNYYTPVSIIVVDAVPAAGTYKYYLLGTKSSGVTTAVAYRCHILATFYPTSYGTVEESKSGINNSSSTPRSNDE